MGHILDLGSIPLVTLAVLEGDGDEIAVVLEEPRKAGRSAELGQVKLRQIDALEIGIVGKPEGRVFRSHATIALTRPGAQIHDLNHGTGGGVVVDAARIHVGPRADIGLACRFASLLGQNTQPWQVAIVRRFGPRSVSRLGDLPARARRRRIDQTDSERVIVVVVFPNDIAIGIEEVS